MRATLAQSNHAKKDISIVIRMHKNFYWVDKNNEMLDTVFIYSAGGFYEKRVTSKILFGSF